MKFELVMLIGALAVGYSLGNAIRELQNHEWCWGIIFLAIAAAIGYFNYRFIRRNSNT